MRSLIKHLKRTFWVEPIKPITAQSVDPIPAPLERETREATRRLQNELRSFEQSSARFRHELAAGALNIVATGKQ